VEGLKHNLLSVRQMCDQGFDFTFNSKSCEIGNSDISKLVEFFSDGNIYILDGSKIEKHCIGKINKRWLWHKRLGHINFDKLVKVKSC